MKDSFWDEFKSFFVFVIGMLVMMAGIGAIYIAGAYWIKALGLE